MGLYERSYMRSGGDAGAGGKAMIKNLIIANIVIFFAAKIAPELGAALILTGASMHRFELYRIVTAAFLHFDFWHIVLNMWGLYLFGSVVAPYLRGRQIFWLYLMGGVIGNLLFVAFNLNSFFALLGASGAVYAITIAAAMLEPERRFVMIFMPFRPVKTSTMVIVFTIIEVLSTLGNHDGVAHLAHLGGFIGGYLYLKLAKVPLAWDPLRKLLPKRNPVSFDREGYGRNYDKQSYRTGGSTSFSGGFVPQQEVDRLLDKISATGINSLTEEELATLRKVREHMNHPGR